MDWMSFLTILVFVFALVIMLAGIFSGVFGSGKSRTMGVVLIVIGAVIALIWAYLVGWSDVALFRDVAGWDLMIDTLIKMIAVIIGALAAVGLFLVAVMKS